MAAITVVPRNSMIDWYTGKANPPVVATRYISVFNGDPQLTGVEVISTITGSANRQPITASMGVAASGASASTVNILFTASAVGSALVNFVGLYDSITAGNLLGSAAVSPKTPAIGDSLSILAPNLTVTLG